MTIDKIPIPLDLSYKFNGIKFHDDIHKYYLGDKNFISVTTLLHKYQEPYDDQYWSEVKALDYGMTQQQVLDMWKAWNIKSQVKGSAIHNYAELLFNNKIYKFSQEDVDKKLGKKNIEILQTYPVLFHEKVKCGLIPKMEGYTIMEEYYLVKKFVDKFYKDTYQKLIPIKTEFVVYDDMWKLAGMMDIIFWNVKKSCFQIWDWKTNKEFTMDNSHQNLKYPLFKLQDTHLNMYSLQLSAYKSIIMRNTDIVIDGLYVVWFHESNDDYKIIECKDFSDYLPRLIENESI